MPEPRSWPSCQPDCSGRRRRRREWPRSWKKDDRPGLPSRAGQPRMGTGSSESAVARQPAGGTGRAPRQDRGRATRLRLLESAVTCLAELGWSGATVAVVAERAGVSRGATQHYFPTREDLFTAALEHMAEIRLAEILREAARLPAGGGQRTRDVVALLVRLYTGPLFRAALQISGAAAVSEALRDLALPLEGRPCRE